MDKIPVADGHAILKRRGFMQVPGSYSPKFETWMSSQGFPEMFPYYPDGQTDFIKSYIDAIDIP